MTHYTYTEIARMLNAHAESFAIHVLGETPTLRRGNTIRFYKDGKLIVTIGGHGIGNWTNFTDDSAKGDMIDLYIWKTQCSKKDALDYAKSWLGIDTAFASRKFTPPPPPDPEEIKKKTDEENQKKINIAQWIWNNTQDQISDSVKKYFHNRGITKDLPSCIRYKKIVGDDLRKIGIDPKNTTHGYLESAVFSATDETGKIHATQQILIDNGKKAKVDVPKITNGLLSKGASVKLGTPTDTLLIAEGPETGLSVWQATGIATWITLGTSNFTKVIPPGTVKTLIIIVDLEEKGYGLASALSATYHFQKQGYTVKLALPEIQNGDFNDVLQKRGNSGVRYLIETALETLYPENYDKGYVLCESPYAALMFWYATGFRVKGTVKSLHPEKHIPQDITSPIWIIQGKSERDFSEKDFTYQKNKKIKFYKTDEKNLITLLENTTEKGLQKILSMSHTLSKTAFYGLDSVIKNPDHKIILTDLRIACDAIQENTKNYSSIAYNPEKINAYSWNSLKDNTLIFAPKNNSHSIEKVAHLCENPSYQDCYLLEYPLFIPKDKGYRQKYMSIPKNYTLKHAVDDGWTKHNFEKLLSNVTKIKKDFEDNTSYF